MAVNVLSIMCKNKTPFENHTYMHILINLCLYCDLHPFYTCKTEGNFGNIDCSEICSYCWFRKRF